MAAAGTYSPEKKFLIASRLHHLTRKEPSLVPTSGASPYAGKKGTWDEASAVRPAHRMPNAFLAG